MLSVFRFVRGYVKVCLTGFSPERFMNLCHNHQIEIWDVVPCEDGYEFYMYADGVWSCKEFLRKTKTKVVIRDKLGLPFLMFRYRKRKLFFMGFAGCFMALFLASRFIWAFEITGNRQFTEDMFLNFLEEQNVTYGMLIKNLDIDSFEKQLREEYDYITWASAKIEGTKLSVSIKENEVGVQETATDMETGELRATAGGTIVSMVTRSGVPAVKQGDTVQEGDLLISGLIPIVNDDETIRCYEMSKADGDVVIESCLPYEEEVAMAYSKKVYTGNTQRLPVFGLGASEWKVGWVRLQEEYELITVRRAVKLLDNLYLPVSYGYNDYIGYRMTDSSYTKEEMKSILNNRFLSFCTTLEEKGVQIIKKDVKIEYKRDKAMMLGNLIVQENAITLCPITEIPEENSSE
jgi:similar to stage IV sporulation protein